MAMNIAGMVKGEPFTIPVGTIVYPVHSINGKLFATSAIKTVRPSNYKTYRLLPTDGNFRSFIFRNKKKGKAFGIALFDTPVKNIIGCIVDFNKALTDLPL